MRCGSQQPGQEEWRRLSQSLTDRSCRVSQDLGRGVAMCLMAVGRALLCRKGLITEIWRCHSPSHQVGLGAELKDRERGTVTLSALGGQSL
jgi:hypothetical protein